MLWLSEVLLQRSDLESFEDLTAAVRERARQGELFFRADVQPPFVDTPEDWEARLERAFTGAPDPGEGG